jgi:magnesium transporter
VESSDKAVHKRAADTVRKVFRRKAAKKPGLRPGTLVHVGEQKAEKLSVNIMDYDATNLTEKTTDTIDDTFDYRDRPTVSWININGLHEVEAIGRFGKHFNVHELALEDIINTGHRPKLEESQDHVFVILKMIMAKENGNGIETEQVSLLIGSGHLITFQEREGDVLDPVRHRIRKTVPRVRFTWPGYLAYAVMDTIVDHYFVVLESMSERIEQIEEELIQDPTPEKLESIYAMKRQLIALRKSIWPLREVIGGLERLESPLVKPEVGPYLRDLYEHVIQIIDTVETMRDTVSGLLDMYMSSVSNRMNEVMKILTIIATIFIPLGFLAGVYGMNFDTSASPFNLPELGMRYGYLLFWAAVVAIGGGLIWYFKRKRWL